MLLEERGESGREAHRVVIVGEAESRPLHVGVEEAAQEARQDRALRDARLLPIQTTADLLGRRGVSKAEREGKERD